MAQFEVPVVRVDRIEEHPGADALEIAVVRGYRCVTKIGAHRAGDLVAYIPEDAIVPEPLIRELRLWDEAKGRGMLAGKKGDRVKAIRLRGVVSQGLLYPVEGREEGENLAAALDIVRYEPPIPVHMQGEVSNVRGTRSRTTSRASRSSPACCATARRWSSPRSSTAPGPASATGPGSTTRNSSRERPSSPRRA